MKTGQHTNTRITITVLFMALIMLMTASVTAIASVMPTEDNNELPDVTYPNGYDPSTDPLVESGYRPRYPSPDSQFIQTPSPVPDDAVFHPYGWTPEMGTASTSTNSDSPTRDAEWTLYYNGTIIDVYVDTSSSGGGELSSSEENALDRIIDDFKNYSWPRVKDYFDPNDKVDHVDFRIHKIDGPSGTGGYYQPGTDEFHLDRDDFNWGGVIAAHEFQHYVHRQYDINENLWVDEGCADFGAYLVYGISSAISSHIYAYLQYRPLHSVVVGDYTFYQDTTTSYYGSSFLFQKYLIEHYGGKNYTHGMVSSTQNGISGVNRGLAASGTDDRFNEAFSKFMVALRVNDENAGSNSTYAFDEKSYTHGSLNLPLTRSHSGSPVNDAFSSPGILSYSVNSVRFSSAPEPGETYQLELTFGSGAPLAAIYYETSPPREVEHIDFGGSRSVSLQMDGWGTRYSSFQLVVSSSAQSTLNYDLDILDLIPPVTDLSVDPYKPDGENGWYVTSPEITITTDGDEDDIYYRLNNGEEKEYSGPITIQDGVWNVSYRAVDRHDNMGDLGFLDLRVDTRTPTTSLSVDPDLPDDRWYTEDPRITISTAHPDTTILYKFNNDDYKEYQGPLNPPEGVSNFFWMSVDQAGNREPSRSREFKLDTVAPSVNYEINPSAPDGINGWYISTPKITLSSEESAELYYSFDGGVFQPYLEPFSVPDGEHTIRMKPVDQAGNQGDELRTDVNVDTTVPEIYGSFEGWTYEEANSSAWLDFAPSLTVEGSENDMTINYSVNGGTPKVYSDAIETHEGTNLIWVHARDEAGNEAPSLRYLLKVDIRDPFVEADVSADKINGWYVQNNVEVSLDLVNEVEEASTVKIEYQWMGEDPSIYRGPINVPEGSSTLLYWATDMAGNRMEARTVDFNKDSMAPAISLELKNDNGTDIEAGSVIIIDLSSSSDENGIDKFHVDFNGEVEIDWTSESTFQHLFEEPGTYNVTGSVKDKAGNVREKVIQVNVRPVEEEVEVQETDDSMDPVVLIALLGVGLLLMILLAVIALLVVKKRSDGGKHNEQQGRHMVSPPSKGHTNGNTSVAGGHVPPPPTPPGY